MNNDYMNVIHLHKDTFEKERKKYPALDRATNVLSEPEAPISGREQALEDLRFGLRNPEKANVILLGDPGTGKTALVQGFSYDSRSVNYMTLQVNVERLAKNKDGDKDVEISNGLLDLVEETKQYSLTHDVIIILFIDEFHKIIKLAPSATESLKPILEHSAANGFRIIAATTFEEYNDYVAPNRALDQRLLRMDLPELGRDAVINILKGRAKVHHIDNFADPKIYGDIYDTSKNILISNSQPRASVDILNSIIGDVTKDDYIKDGELHRSYYTPQELNLPSKYLLSRPLLNRVIRRSYGIDIDNNVDIHDLEKALNSRIFNQKQAVRKMLSLLEMSLAGFNDPTRPKISMLFTGETGVGKTEAAKVTSETLRIPLKRFDMSRYPRPEDAVDFANQLANAAWSAPNAYILIDEAEKSTKECMNILLQVLDDARLTSPNNPNRVISFSGNIITLTTNAASGQMQHAQRYGNTDKNDEMIQDEEIIYQALSHTDAFSTAVLGRIDAIVPFSSLPKVGIAKITERELSLALDIAQTNKRKIFVSPDIVPYIAIDRTSSDGEHGGARDVRRNVKSLIISPLAHAMTNDTKQYPLAIRLDSVPRFKNPYEPDPKRAHVVVDHCYPMTIVNNWLNAIGSKLNRKIENAGCFVPMTGNVSNDQRNFIKGVLQCIKNGSLGVKTTIDIDKTIVIDENDNIDITNNKALVESAKTKSKTEQKQKAGDK